MHRKHGNVGRTWICSLLMLMIRPGRIWWYSFSFSFFFLLIMGNLLRSMLCLNYGPELWIMHQRVFGAIGKFFRIILLFIWKRTDHFGFKYKNSSYSCTKKQVMLWESRKQSHCNVVLFIRPKYLFPPKVSSNLNFYLFIIKISNIYL